MAPTEKVTPASAGPFRWVRGRSRFEDGAIVIDPGTLQEYSVLESGQGVLWKFAAIRQPRDAVDFARRFGLLTVCDPQEEELREPWSEWESEVRSLDLTLTCLAALRAAEAGDPKAIAFITDITSDPLWAMQFKDPNMEWVLSSPAGIVREATSDDERLIQLAEWIAIRINVESFGTRWGIVTQADTLIDGKRGKPSRFRVSPRPIYLLGWIYYELANLLVESQQIRHCEGCGVMFPVKDGRQRFHDERCAARVRYHRAAEKKQQEKKETGS